MGMIRRRVPSQAALSLTPAIQCRFRRTPGNSRFANGNGTVGSISRRNGVGTPATKTLTNQLLGERRIGAWRVVAHRLRW